MAHKLAPHHPVTMEAADLISQEAERALAEDAEEVQLRAHYRRLAEAEWETMGARERHGWVDLVSYSRLSNRHARRN